MKERASDCTTTTIVEEGAIDELLSKAGFSGVVQIAVCTGVLLFALTVVCHLGLIFFTGHSPPWKCVDDAKSNFCQKHNHTTFTVDMEMFNHRCHLNRTEWRYMADKQYSVVTEFDLVCDKTNTGALISTLFFVGSAVGAFLCGPIGDVYGRKPTISVLIAVTLIASISLGYSQRIWLMCLLQFFRGVGITSLYPVYVYLSEISPPEFRTTAVMITTLIMCLSYILMDLMAMVLQNWRTLSTYLGFVGIPSLVCFIYLPESPRWLVAKERRADAEMILSKFFQLKSSEKLHICQEISPKDTPEVYTYWHLVNNWKVLKLVLASVFIYSVLPILYYTIGAQSLNYGGNMYINYMLACIPDIPASFAAIFLMNRLGRKKTILGCCFGSGLFIGAVALVSRSTINRRLIIMSLTVLSKFCCSVAFDSLFIWTPEIFPTVLRAQAMAICGTFERVAMIAVPLIVTLLQSISFSLPFVLMCVLGVLGSLVGLILPETKDQPIKDTYLEFVYPSTTSNSEIGRDNTGKTCSTDVLTV